MKYLVYLCRVSGKLDYPRAQSSEVMGKRRSLQLIGNVMRRIRKKKII
jgi:hypothetical protein